MSWNQNEMTIIKLYPTTLRGEQLPESTNAYVGLLDETQIRCYIPRGPADYVAEYFLFLLDQATGKYMQIGPLAFDGKEMDVRIKQEEWKRSGLSLSGIDRVVVFVEKNVAKQQKEQEVLFIGMQREIKKKEVDKPPAFLERHGEDDLAQYIAYLAAPIDYRLCSNENCRFDKEVGSNGDE